ncbi:MAG: single-stranded DNA-binding protein [Desulfovibrionaceae bacterium]|nr:single-stranded DNA-binding protein [Desulfovibrionaceae bacterium]
MLNKVMIIGRLGQNPEMKYAQNGTPMCQLNIATDESYVDRNGSRVENTEWHRVIVFQKQAETCSQYLRKGSLVYVEGSLRTRKWEDQNGNPRSMVEIRAQRVQFLDRRNDIQNAPYPEPAAGDEVRHAAEKKQGNHFSQDVPPSESMDDVPF